MVVPDDHTGVKQYRLSSRALKLGLGAGALVLLILSSMALGFLMLDGQKSEAERLAQANAALVQQLDGMRTDLATLEESLDELSVKDARYRLLANLEPLDDDVKLAGVGGPGSRTVEATSLYEVDEPLAELAFETEEELNALIRRAEVLATSWDDATEAMEEQVDTWERTPSIMPTRGYKSSSFSRNRMHPILNVRRPHKGIDIVAHRGTPVVAAAKGTVRFAGNTGGDYGYMVDIDHGDGVVTRYAHLAKGSVVVRRGQQVDRWEKIAEVGTTGLVTSPSIHYEVVVNGRAQDPDEFVLSEVLAF
jgi:murein DD-endopeptidase MepM/ murein hydrolase activator NlpD